MKPSSSARQFEPGDLGVTIFTGHQPVKKPCVDCPFTADREGRGYLHPKRMEDLKFGATLGQSFACHKTVYRKGVEMIDGEDGVEEAPSWHPLYQQCAGAIEFALKIADDRGIEPTIIGRDGRKENELLDRME